VLVAGKEKGRGNARRTPLVTALRLRARCYPIHRFVLVGSRCGPLPSDGRYSDTLGIAARCSTTTFPASLALPAAGNATAKLASRLVSRLPVQIALVGITKIDASNYTARKHSACMACDQLSRKQS
jgi:hypothetical protein